VKAGSEEELDEPQEALEDRADTRGSRDAILEITSMWAQDAKFRSSAMMTLETALYAWGEHSVQDATADGEDAITADWLLAGNNTLYLVAPAEDQQRLQGLFTTLIRTIIGEAFNRSTRSGQPIDPRLLVVIDEAANTAPLPDLDVIASTGPGQGVTLLTVLQNMSQANETWGREKAETIIANHRAKLFGTGISDPSTHAYLAQVLGDRVVERSSTTKDRGKLLERGSRTESLEHRTEAACKHGMARLRHAAAKLKAENRVRFAQLMPLHSTLGSASFSQQQ